MIFDSTTTLIVVTRDRVVRAEFRTRSATPKSVVVRERPESDDPVSAVVAALGNDRRSPGRVFVLSSDVWTRTIEVPALNLRNMSVAELQQSLAFEVEPLSGLNPIDAATAAVPLSDSQKLGDVWIGQLPTNTLAEIDEVIRGAGGKLAGVLHPAGVPVSLHSDGLTVRVEFWADATARVVADGKRLTTLQVEQAAATANREAIVNEWRRQSPAVATVDVLIPDFRPAIADERTFADEAVLEAWLAAWHQVLAARHPTAPMVRPAPRPLTSQQRRNIALVCGALALAACIGHGYWVGRGIEAAVAEQNRVEEPGRELATITQQQTATDKSLKKLREDLAKRAAEVVQAEEMLVAHRRRLGDLLERLGHESSSEWVLRSIEGTPRELKLLGVTMHPEHISVLAAELARDLAKLGWAVEPPNHLARNLRDDGGPWSFELRLRDETVPRPNATPGLTPGLTPPPTPAGPPNLVRVPME